MVDVHETPAVPPFDAGGDVRLGYYLAGGVLIALGWGGAVAVNLLLHVLAPASGHWLFHLYFGRTIGPYAWGTFGLGLVGGGLGLVLLLLARRTAKGPFVLPGMEY